ncbi:MAG TPA: HD domain-containing phosphohydrolase [Comamonas sp.]
MSATEGADALLNPSALHNDAHFLRAVTEMADSQEVVAGNAIYSESGIKLLDQGVRIDSRLYERLIQHRLAAALDDQLTARNTVDIRALEAQVHLLSGSTALGRLLQRFMGDKHYMLLEVLRHMKWPARASFKMTVMRHQLPDLFEHSILMMMCAVCLAVEEKMSLNDCSELAAAALLHDVGMLFMPPTWRDPKYKLSPQERKQLAAHSITAMLVVRSANVYSARAEDAVLQHHERADGSGYPSNLKGQDISHWGHILMLAEVVSAFFSKFDDIPAQRLSLMLRMNHNRFHPVLTQHVYELLSHDEQDPSVSVSHTGAEVRKVVAKLGAVMQHWIVCKRKLPERWQTMRNGRACVYVDMRMLALEKSLAESGSHPRQQADWLKMFEEDPSSMSELVMINKEALWQVESCVQTCMRRWPQVLNPGDELDDALCDWLVNCSNVLGHPVQVATEALH